jgi:hypothetical protein
MRASEAVVAQRTDQKDLGSPQAFLGGESFGDQGPIAVGSKEQLPERGENPGRVQPPGASLLTKPAGHAPPGDQRTFHLCNPAEDHAMDKLTGGKIRSEEGGTGGGTSAALHTLKYVLTGQAFHPCEKKLFRRAEPANGDLFHKRKIRISGMIPVNKLKQVEG